MSRKNARSRIASVNDPEDLQEPIGGRTSATETTPLCLSLSDQKRGISSASAELPVQKEGHTATEQRRLTPSSMSIEPKEHLPEKGVPTATEHHRPSLSESNQGAHTATETEHDRLRESFVRSLQPGDHIAAMRENGLYWHHGIFKGTCRGLRWVIHFQGPDASYVKGPASLICNSKCGYQHPEKGGRVISCLDCFSQGENMIKFQYMKDVRLVSDRDPNWNRLKDGKVIQQYRTKKYFLEYLMDGEIYGHSRVPNEKVPKYALEDRVKFYYNMVSNRSSAEVLAEALNSELEAYNLGSNNCEHFAIFCKTGLRKSIQVQTFPLPLVLGNRKRSRCRKKRGFSLFCF